MLLLPHALGLLLLSSPILLAYLVANPLGIIRSVFASTYTFASASAGGVLASTSLSSTMRTTTTGSMNAIAPMTTTGRGRRDAKNRNRAVFFVASPRRRIRSRRRRRDAASSSFAFPPHVRDANGIMTTPRGTREGDGAMIVMRSGGGMMEGKDTRYDYDDDYDDDEYDDGEYLRRAIGDLVSIVHPSRDSTTSSYRDEITTSDSSSMSSSSIVHIVGTGLNPTLMNLPLSTLYVLSRADVVLYDSLGLSHADIRRLVPKHCDVICVGKRGDGSASSWRQADIDNLLLEKACEYPLPPTTRDDGRDDTKTTTTTTTMRRRRCIVRLKGGDPFLFGRTRSEIDVLRCNRVPYTYTPGISSCIAGPHLGGIPLTDPTLDCQSFGVWSGTDTFGRSRGLKYDGCDDDSGLTIADELRRGLSGVDVLVFLMIGRLDKLDALCRVIANNQGDTGDDTGKWNANTPCAVIQNAGGISEVNESTTTLPLQRVWRSTLGNIVNDIRGEDANRSSVSPAVFVVGATASLDLLSQDSQL